MITGAWSVIFYGRPRASHDIDFVVDLHPQDVDWAVRAIEKLPSEFLIQKDMVSEGIRKKGLFQIIHQPTLLKVDVWLLTDDAFDQSRFQRKKTVMILDTHIVISSAEDTILQKLRWYKDATIEKHIVDAACVYQIQGDRLDKKYMKLWADKLKVTKYLNQLDTMDLEQYM